MLDLRYLFQIVFEERLLVEDICHGHDSEGDNVTREDENVLGCDFAATPGLVRQETSLLMMGLVVRSAKVGVLHSGYLVFHLLFWLPSV